MQGRGSGRQETARLHVALQVRENILCRPSLSPSFRLKYRLETVQIYSECLRVIALISAARFIIRCEVTWLLPVRLPGSHFSCRFLSRKEISRNSSSETGQREGQFSDPEVIRFEDIEFVACSEANNVCV